MILDRLSLSRKNGWKDEQGRIFIYFTLKNIEQQLFVGHAKAVPLLDMLEGSALIRRQRQGMGRPSRIYPRRFSQRGVHFPNFMKYENQTSVSMESELHEVRFPASNNKEKNKTEENEIESYPFSPDEMGSDEEGLSAWFNRQCAFEALIGDMPESREEILEIRDLILEVCTSRRPTIRICGEMKPLSVVRSRFMKLNVEHIRYVLNSLSENSRSVKNIRQYILAALYNATMTMGNYYRAIQKIPGCGRQNAQEHYRELRCPPLSVRYPGAPGHHGLRRARTRHRRRPENRSLSHHE